MKVIALVGNSDKGKTTTLNLLLIELLNQGYTKESYDISGGDSRDFKTILVKNGVKVGISTVGDFKVNDKGKGEISSGEYNMGCRTFIDYIEEFRNDRCHKVVCAISADFEKKEEIEIINKFLPDFNYIVYKTTSGNPSLQDYENNKDVNTILDLLNS